MPYVIQVYADYTLGTNKPKMAIHIPQSNGKWQNPQSPGNSVWFPDLDSRPLGANDPYRPYKFRHLVLLNLKKSLNLTGISPIKIAAVKINLFRFSCGLMGIRFYNGEPDFSPFAIATVKVGKYMDVRYGSKGTMPQADKLLAKRLGIPEKEVRQWINDNQYVWHERQDGKKIDLLCHDIHGNIPHRGGISKNRERFAVGIASVYAVPRIQCNRCAGQGFLTCLKVISSMKTDCLFCRRRDCTEEKFEPSLVWGGDFCLTKPFFCDILTDVEVLKHGIRLYLLER